MERSDRRAMPAYRGQAYSSLLLRGAIRLWVLLPCVFASLGGCAQKTHTLVYAQGNADGAGPDAGPAPVLVHVQCGNSALLHCGRPCWHIPAGEPQASLIFLNDPDLAPIPADQIARANWPTTAGLTSYGQTVYYRQYWNDQQGLGPYYTNYGYRTFTSWMTGVQAGP